MVFRFVSKTYTCTRNKLLLVLHCFWPSLVTRSGSENVVEWVEWKTVKPSVRSKCMLLHVSAASCSFFHFSFIDWSRTQGKAGTGKFYGTAGHMQLLKSFAGPGRYEWVKLYHLVYQFLAVGQFLFLTEKCQLSYQPHEADRTALAYRGQCKWHRNSCKHNFNNVITVFAEQKLPCIALYTWRCHCGSNWPKSYETAPQGSIALPDSENIFGKFWQKYGKSGNDLD